MKGIRQYFKDIIKELNLNPPKEVGDFVYSDEIRKTFFEKELQNVIDIVCKIWDKNVSYFDVINKGGTDDVVLVRSYFSILMRKIKKNGRKLHSFQDIGNFINKRPNTIKHYCDKIEKSKKEKQLFAIFNKHYKKK